MFFLVFTFSSQAESLRPEDLLIQAKAKLEANHYADSEQLLREFLRHQPAHVEASFLLGVVLAKQEQWMTAGRALEHTIDLNPRFAPARQPPPCPTTWRNPSDPCCQFVYSFIQ